MEKRLFDLQADKIETVLATMHAPARVWGGCLTPNSIHFHLAPAITTHVTKIEMLTRQIALALGARSARLMHIQGKLTLEVPRSDARVVDYTELLVHLHKDPHVPRALAVPGTALLGTDSDGLPLLLRLSSPDVAHCLISGTTASGKTELARTLVAGLASHQPPQQIRLALFDCPGRGLDAFGQLPHLLFPIAHRPRQMIDGLRFLVAEIERRELSQVERPRIVVMVDEMEDMLHSCGRESENLLMRLVRQGQGVGISIVACAPRPLSRTVGALMRAEFPMRIVGRVASPEDARVAAGIGGTGAEKLRGQGDFVLVAAGQVLRFQAARIRPEQMPRILADAFQSRLESANDRLRRVK